MNSTYRIGHISDTHISRQYYREHIKSLKLLLREMLREGVDHIVVSGDIVSTADEDDYYLAREIFASAKLLSAEKLTVVPGNHDIFGGPHRAVDILSFPQHIHNVDYVRAMTLFQQAFAETFKHVYCLSPSSIFPFVKIVDRFALIGLNSIPPWSFRKNILGTNGQLDEEQLEGLCRLIDNGLHNKIPVAVLHHHFNDTISADVEPQNSLWRKIETATMRMYGRRRIVQLFKNIGVRYVLHGHIHKNEIYERNSIQFLNAAGAVCDDPIRFLKYNVIEYQRDCCHVRIRQLPIPYQVSTVTQTLHRKHQPLRLPTLLPDLIKGEFGEAHYRRNEHRSQELFQV